MSIRTLAIPAILISALAGTVQAQQPSPDGEGVVVGRIVAIVGDSALTAYDLQQALQQWRAEAGRELPTGPELERLAQQILEAQIDQLLLLQDAEKDTTLVVDPQAVAQRTEEEIGQLRQRFGGDVAFQRALDASGITLAGFREERASLISKDMRLDMYVNKLTRTRSAPPITEEELRAYFEANRAAYGRRPPTISFTQLVLPTQPSDSALTAARELADSVFLLAYDGKEDFETLARRFSQDTGTRDRGGDLGWFQQGDMMRAFEQAAYAIRPGSVGPPVRTSYGLHIIKVERARGSERQARHILIKPEITDADVERTRQLGDELATALRAGASLDSLMRIYGDPDEQRHVGPVPSDSLPAPYDQQLGSATEGTYIGPFQLADETGARPPMFAIVYVTDVNTSGEYSLDDPLVRSALRRQLERDKVIEERVRELRRSTHIEIRSG